MADLIDRTKAIDTVYTMCERCDTGEITDYRDLMVESFKVLPSAQPEQRWIPCSEPPEDDKNVFIAHGTEDFMTCCIGHYDHDSGQWYEDRNWFAKLIFDGMYWCEMPILPKTEE